MLLSIPFLKKINIFVYFILTILNLYVILNGIKGVDLYGNRRKNTVYP